MDELAVYFRPLVDERRINPGDDVVSAGRVGSAETHEMLVATLLEADHETLHGGLANLWFLLLTNPDELQLVTREPRLMKFACYETLRHSAPVVMARRFARHEVERFGRLLPEGAHIILSAAAANRDPRMFSDPDTFDVARKDLCQREPRGSIEPTGCRPASRSGLGSRRSIRLCQRTARGRPTRARPRHGVDREPGPARRHPDLGIADGATPTLRSLRWGEMHTCWSLPVSW